MNTNSNISAPNIEPPDCFDASDLRVSGETARLILNNAHSLLWRKYRNLELWVLARDLIGHGSGLSQQVCQSANLDPFQFITKSRLSDLKK